MPVVDFMVKPRGEGGFGLEAITDFASVFTDKDYDNPRVLGPDAASVLMKIVYLAR